MSYIALYRKWRPLTFADVVEQTHIVTALKNSIKSDRISHAYLFCGTRGTGKTSMAKILAKAINCVDSQDGNPCGKCEICVGLQTGEILDVIEIDAASNNSVDNIRDIRDEVMYLPVKARYKVYIIDEVHMLSIGAFNALLKTLEEPPGHVIFILATTEPHKLPATILSRCQRYDFKRISLKGIQERVALMTEDAGVTYEKKAIRMIAALANGALRDGTSILDQCLSIGESNLTLDLVLKMTGMSEDKLVSDMVDAITKKDVQTALIKLDEVIQSGKDLLRFIQSLTGWYRDLLIIQMSNAPEDLITASEGKIKKLKIQASQIHGDDISFIIREIASQESVVKWASQPRIVTEVLIIRLCKEIYGKNTLGMEEKITKLERQIQKLTTNGVVITETVKQPMPEISERKPAPKKVQPENITTNQLLAGFRPPIQRKEEMPDTNNAPTGKVKEWDMIKNELMSLSRMMIVAMLENTHGVWVSENRIEIVLDQESEIKRTRLKNKNNLDVIEQAIKSVLNRKVKVGVQAKIYNNNIENDEEKKRVDAALLDIEKRTGLKVEERKY